jgi:glycosyltransferase involved in cell wall biosynthesis
MINFQAPINSLGYGVAGYNIFKKIIKIHPSAALYPISKPEFTDEYIARGLANRGNTSLFPSVKMWHQNDVHTHVGKGEHIGFPIFELTEFSEEEKLSMSHCDRLFVCSKWAKGVLIKNNIKNPEDIHVVPLGVDTDIFKPTTSRNDDKTVFFNCGKWETRKGHDVLLQCFNAAFEPKDNVELWMMCDNPFIGRMNDQWKNLYKNSRLGDKIKFIPRQETHEDVYNIMRRVDCGVFPARAEGWNLELLEMMACGKSVIATNYSAHTEFCSPDNSFLVSMNKRERAYDGVFFDGSKGYWASFEQEERHALIEHMRLNHFERPASQHSNTQGIETASKFTWENSAKELLNGLKL